MLFYGGSPCVMQQVVVIQVCGILFFQTQNVFCERTDFRDCRQFSLLV